MLLCLLQAMTGKNYIETYKYIKKMERIQSDSIQC